jgi:hypothetical protein
LIAYLAKLALGLSDITAAQFNPSKQMRALCHI